jgi:hypothetical protein
MTVQCAKANDCNLHRFAYVFDADSQFKQYRADRLVQEEDRTVSKRLIYRMIWMPSAIALIVTFVFFLGHMATAAAPAAMTTYTMSDKSMQMQHPSNWKANESSQNGVGDSVRFVVDEYSGIRFNTDLIGSLMADIDKANNAQMSNLASLNPNGPSTPTSAGKSPLEKAHERKGEELGKNKDFENYQEGQARTARIAGQEALISDFTYTEHGMMGNKEEVGLRATALLGESRLLILDLQPPVPSDGGDRLIVEGFKSILLGSSAALFGSGCGGVLERSALRR